MVGFLNHQHSLACFSKILGRDTTTTTTAHNDHIGLNNLWLVARWDLQEIVREALCWHTEDWSSREPDHGAESRTDRRPGLLENRIETTVDGANGAQTGGFPTAKDLLPDLHRLVLDGRGRAGEDERTGSRAAESEHH